eukprot:8115892-Alexandrium_andersonii.AAC.1
MCIRDSRLRLRALGAGLPWRRRRDRALGVPGPVMTAQPMLGQRASSAPGLAVRDVACQSTMCGESWRADFTARLGEL